MVTIGTVGPAVIGTIPTGLPRMCCRATWRGTLCACGSKALSSGLSGLPSWLTVSGVQTCPVLGSLNSNAPVEAATSRLLRGAWAKAAEANVIAARQARTLGIE